jgi:diguanylate cyclase (GGDEF)-like protein
MEMISHSEIRQHEPMIDQDNSEAWELRDTDPARAARLSLACYERALAGNYRRGMAHSMATGSFLAYRDHDFVRALNLAHEALDILDALGETAWKPRLYNNLAIIYGDLGERALAWTYLDKQIRQSIEIGDRQAEAIGYHDMALFQVANNLPAALLNLNRALTVSQEIQDEQGIASNLHNLADLHFHEMHDPSSALPLAERAHDIISKLHLQSLMLHNLCLLADIRAALGSYEMAGTLIAQAETIAAEQPSALMAIVAATSGRCELLRGDADRALKHFLHALSITEANDARELMQEQLEQIASCYELLGDYQHALHYHRRYVAVREQIYRADNEQQLMALEVVHRTQMMQREAELANQKNSELQRYISELETMRNKLQEWSYRDYLTGLYNRRYLMEHATRLLKHAQRYGESLCLIMFDVDHFKRINDNYSHQTGDLVLQHIARIANETLRSTDLVARYGGEEFVAVLPETDTTNGALAGERLRRAIEHYRWEHIQPDMHLTISLGMVVLVQNHSFEDLLRRVDNLLYEAKRQGRNRLCY